MVYLINKCLHKYVLAYKVIKLHLNSVIYLIKIKNKYL